MRSAGTTAGQDPARGNSTWDESNWDESAQDEAAWDEHAQAARDEATVRRGFWRKLGGLAARVPFAEDLLTAYYCAFDRTTPFQVRAALLGALAYFVLPADAVPDVLPVLGFADDAAVLAGALRMVMAHIGEEHRQAAQEALARIRGGVA